jgi:amidohydrolase
MMRQADLKLLEPRLLELFEYLHANPEPSWEEWETTKFLAQYLANEGYEPHLFEDSPGLYVEIGSGKPVIGLRTDIDSLFQEVDGVHRANHSCGHDGHMTMAVGVLLMLKHLKDTEEFTLRSGGTIRVIFQPAEEKGNGALAMVDRGIIDDIDYLFGVHVRPIQELAVGKHAPSLNHGASMMVQCEIYGEEAHAARPHLGKNAIEIGGSLIEALKTIRVDTRIPWSVKVTKFSAGVGHGNTIPGKATLTMDARAQTNAAMEQLDVGIKRAIRSIREMYDAQINAKILLNIPAAEVDEEAEEIIRRSIVQSVGDKHLAEPVVTPGGEDFHFYTKMRPHVKAAMLGLGCGVTPGLHHPHMTFDRSQLINGVEILTNTVINAMQYAKMNTMNV